MNIFSFYSFPLCGPFPPFDLMLQTLTALLFDVAEPATPEGVGRRAEGSDDVGRAADIVLQRGTQHPPSSPSPFFPRVCQKRE